MTEQVADDFGSQLRERARTARDPDYDVESLLVERWSPRAMSGEPLEEAEFLPLFEAARWAPSAYNNQHWRFLYATRDDEEWGTFFDLLADANQAWASEAAVLVVLVSKTAYEHNGDPARTHSFDTGAAWENLALEATARGLVAHGMSGFDYEAAAEDLNVPDGFDVEAMVAVGNPAPEDVLPEDYREREMAKGRKPLEEIVVQGGFDDEE
jgi:nitroreductase